MNDAPNSTTTGPRANARHFLVKAPSELNDLAGSRPPPDEYLSLSETAVSKNVRALSAQTPGSRPARCASSAARASSAESAEGAQSRCQPSPSASPTACVAARTGSTPLSAWPLATALRSASATAPVSAP